MGCFGALARKKIWRISSNNLFRTNDEIDWGFVPVANVVADGIELSVFAPNNTGAESTPANPAKRGFVAQQEQDMKKASVFRWLLSLCVVVRIKPLTRPGLEPGKSEPKSDVLPLHHRVAENDGILE